MYTLMTEIEIPSRPFDGCICTVSKRYLNGDGTVYLLSTFSNRIDGTDEGPPNRVITTPMGRVKDYVTSIPDQSILPDYFDYTDSIFTFGVSEELRRINKVVVLLGGERSVEALLMLDYFIQQGTVINHLSVQMVCSTEEGVRSIYEEAKDRGTDLKTIPIRALTCSDFHLAYVEKYLNLDELKSLNRTRYLELDHVPLVMRREVRECLGRLAPKIAHLSIPKTKDEGIEYPNVVLLSVKEKYPQIRVDCRRFPKLVAMSVSSTVEELTVESYPDRPLNLAVSSTIKDTISLPKVSGATVSSVSYSYDDEGSTYSYVSHEKTDNLGSREARIRLAEKNFGLYLDRGINVRVAFPFVNDILPVIDIGLKKAPKRAQNS